MVGHSREIKSSKSAIKSGNPDIMAPPTINKALGLSLSVALISSTGVDSQRIAETFVNPLAFKRATLPFV